MMKDVNTPEWSLDSYDFHLPQTQIAQFPAHQRDQSKLMLLHQHHALISHHRFFEIIDLLPSDAVLVVNNTKVIPARLFGKRKTGATIETLLLTEVEKGVWEAWVKKAKRLKAGEKIDFAQGNFSAIADQRLENGNWLLRFIEPEYFYEKLETFGVLPLPPYIERTTEQDQQRELDKHRYQTIYASQKGAIAAPTAGLHFTSEILQKIQARGIPLIEITLHVGAGTFAPIRTEDIREYAIHSEYYHVSAESSEVLKQVIEQNKKIIGIGTTVVRVLETIGQNFTGESLSGTTNCYIYPPYRFQVVQGMLTNFHLPKSSLLLLVSAMYGREKLLSAYQTAIEENYRFFSYGDCMLIL